MRKEDGKTPGVHFRILLQALDTFLKLMDFGLRDNFGWHGGGWMGRIDIKWKMYRIDWFYYTWSVPVVLLVAYVFPILVV